MLEQSSRFTLTGAFLALAAPAFAGGDLIQINEVYASHVGTDDQEFLELEGTPGMSLDLHMVLIVEGDDSVFGTLDRVWSLTGQTMPGDGFFVIGTTLVGPDLDVGASNTIENGSETFYLVRVDSAQTRQTIEGMLGTNVDADGDLITDIATTPGVTIVDIIAMVDADATDRVYDGAAVLGPDGSFFPAGIYRKGSGSPTPGAPWCPDFLAFDLGIDRTPGTQNYDCAGGSSDCVSYCQANPNSTGAAAVLSVDACNPSLGAGNPIDLRSQPVPNQPSIFFYASNTARIAFGNGFLCATGNIVRSPVVIGAGNVATYAFPLPSGVVAGDVRHYQHWYRDPAGGGAGYNTSDGVSVTFTP